LPQKKSGKWIPFAASPSLGCLETTAILHSPQQTYCRSLVTSCCTLLACASAAIPV
jgi:hypothetical protein